MILKWEQNVQAGSQIKSIITGKLMTEFSSMTFTLYRQPNNPGALFAYIFNI